MTKSGYSTVQVREDVLNQFRRYCKRKGLWQSRLATRILKSYLEKHDKKNNKK